MGGEGAVKLSLRLNWLNGCDAGGTRTVRFIGNVFEVSLNKYLVASVPTGLKNTSV